MSDKNSTALVSRGELAKLAEQINAQHVEAERSLRAGLERARNIGLLLPRRSAESGVSDGN